ncbi:PP2C family protein-serine/threonine phosphatase [Streptomyces sp. SID11385]|uniref:PP2C family protein-serine/threonine phosphatase n=1 Tax=Streptomyces sp. SID11385 TaxID=2706031 RepID=UPI0013CA921C|nr:PP2C family protein-serine/threonine phosphatase [Streptomyces sp. SID11385]NEA38565.1 serine/threonine-protein phosphatase [Streptomyces sp. SID11385]
MSEPVPPPALRRGRRSVLRPAVLVPVASMVVLGAVDLAVPRSVHLGPLIAVAPALTAASAGPGTTAGVGVLAVVLQFLLGVAREETDTPNTAVQVAAVAVISLALVLYSRARSRRESELARVRAMADATNDVLLRPPPARTGPLRIGCEYRAAGEVAQIGGDFYAVARTREGTRLLIGDVRGKGLDALDDTALLLGAFRSAAHLGLSLPGLAAHLDAALEWSNAQKGAAEDFATALLVDVPDAGEDALLLSCGHPPPYVLRASGPEPLEAARPAPPLGLGALDPDAWTVQRYAFGPGETMLLYTDGVIEARNGDGTFYPLAERLALFGGDDGDRLARRVVEDVVRHTHDRLADDAALLCAYRARE